MPIICYLSEYSVDGWGWEPVDGHSPEQSVESEVTLFVLTLNTSEDIHQVAVLLQWQPIRLT